MASEKLFINENVKKLKIKKFIESELSSIGWGKIQVYKTPLGMRVLVHTSKPGLVIGHKGSTIQALTETLKEKYGLENPQIEVNQVEVEELNVCLMAQSVASALERGIQFRRAAHSAVRRIMDAGAQGVEIIVSGKLTGERAKAEKFREGFIKHTGEMKEHAVQDAKVQARLKPGVLGVRVRLVPPETSLVTLKFKEKMEQEEQEQTEEEKKEEKVEEEKEGGEHGDTEEERN